jgi:hypothetical protein
MQNNFTQSKTLQFFLRTCFLSFLMSMFILQSNATVISVPSTPGTDTTSLAPVNRRTAYSACRFYYTPTEVGTTGTISGIGFQKASGSTAYTVNYVQIYMKEVTTLITTTVPTLSGYTLVYNGYIDNTMTSGWTTVPLSAGFNYSGTSNLDIVIVKGNETATTSFPVYNCNLTTGTNTTAYYYGSSALGTTFTGVNVRRPNIQLTIASTCSGTPTSGTVTGPTTAVCPSTNYTLLGSGATIAGGIHYQWQSRPSGIGLYTNMVNDTFISVTKSTTVNMDYRLVTTCTFSGFSNTSAGFTVTVLAAPSISASSDTTFCAGNSVLLNSTTVSGATYTWYNGPTNTGSTGATYSATTGGSYTVVASTSSCTGISSNAILVTVNPLPTAAFTALSATTFCSGDSVKLQATTSAGVTYQWQLGGTDIPSATNPLYKALAGGAYRVKVTNTTTGCIAYSSPLTITVNPTPAAPVISGAGGATSYCASGSLVLSTTPVSGIGYQWKKTTGIIVGATSSSYTVSIPETYTLIATQGACSSTSNSLTITQNPLPIATITPTGSVSFCGGDSLKIQAPSASGVTYQWLLSGSPISGAPTTNFYWIKTAGAYSVKVTNTTTGCSDVSSTLTVNVITPVVPTISAGSATTFCIGNSVTLTATVATGLTPQWQESEMDILGSITTTYVASTTGLYRMKVIDGVGCTAYSNEIPVTVNPKPNTTLSLSVPTDICNGDVEVITAPIIARNKYQWKNSGVDITGSTSNPFYATVAGTYSVKIVDSNGCADTSAPVAVTVKYVSPFSVMAHGNTYFCDGSSVQLSTKSGYTTYQWYYNGAYIPGATDTITTATKTGKYAVKVKDPINGCTATSPGFNILVIASPDSPAITHVGNRLSTSVTGVSYQWYKNGIAIAGATDSFILISSDGLYVVEVTNANDCSRRGNIYITGLGVNNIGITTHSIKVYPNPTRDKLYIDAPDAAAITINDIQGKTLYEQKNTQPIDMSNFAAGMYIIILTDKDNQRIGIEKVNKINE